MYASKDDYTKIYASEAKIPDGSIELYLRRASALLNSMFIYKPVEPIEDTLKEKLQMATFEIAELLYTEDSFLGVTSENNDGYSVSYDKKSVSSNIKDTVVTYFADTGLLYRGIG